MKKKIAVDIVLPVYYGNVPELEESVDRLAGYGKKNLQNYAWTIVIAVNGKQPEKIISLAKKLEKKYANQVVHVYTPHPGKGHGVLEAWTRRKPDIYTYMDVDLSTDLQAYKALLKKIQEGCDIVVGSRYHKDAKIKRSLKRYVISRGYIVFFYRSILRVPIHDAQCGFKAVNRRVVQEILPLIKDKVWFWESEMLYLAHKKGCMIKEIPVVWTERKISGVNMMKIIPNFIKNVIRMRLTKLP